MAKDPKILAAAISEIKANQVAEVNLASQELNDADAAQVAEALIDNTQLRQLMLQKNQIGDKGALALAAAMEGNNSLVVMNLNDNPMTGNGYTALINLILADNNLIYVNEDDPLIGTHSQQKRIIIVERTRALHKKIEALEKAPGVCEIPKEEVLLIARKLPAIEHLCKGVEKEDVERFIDSLPYVDISKPVKLGMLLKKDDATGFAPIDNPRTWEQWGEVMGALNRSGTQLRGDVLLENGKPSRLFETIIRNKGTAAIFSEANWQGANVRELKAVIRALSPQVKNGVENIHQLVSWAEQQNGATRQASR